MVSALVAQSPLSYLPAGLDPNMQRNGRNCFWTACRHGHAHIVQYLVQHTLVDTIGKVNWYSSYDEEGITDGVCTGAARSCSFPCSSKLCCLAGWDAAILERHLAVHTVLLTIAAGHPSLKAELPR